MFRITVTEENGPSETFTFEVDELTIGRVKGNDIVLPTGNVSKKHARLAFEGRRVLIYDLKSTNGTLVDGLKVVAPTVIQPGTQIEVGEYTLTLLEARPGSVRTESPQAVPALTALPPSALPATPVGRMAQGTGSPDVVPVIPGLMAPPPALASTMDPVRPTAQVPVVQLPERPAAPPAEASPPSAVVRPPQPSAAVPAVQLPRAANPAPNPPPFRPTGAQAVAPPIPGSVPDGPVDSGHPAREPARVAAVEPIPMASPPRAAAPAAPAPPAAPERPSGRREVPSGSVPAVAADALTVLPAWSESAFGVAWEALCERLLEEVPADALPLAGGTATAVRKSFEDMASTLITEVPACRSLTLANNEALVSLVAAVATGLGPIEGWLARPDVRAVILHPDGSVLVEIARDGGAIGVERSPLGIPHPALVRRLQERLAQRSLPAGLPPCVVQRAQGSGANAHRWFRIVRIPGKNARWAADAAEVVMRIDDALTRGGTVLVAVPQSALVEPALTTLLMAVDPNQTALRTLAPHETQSPQGRGIHAQDLAELDWVPGPLGVVGTQPGAVAAWLGLLARLGSAPSLVVVAATSIERAVLSIALAGRLSPNGLAAWFDMTVVMDLRGKEWTLQAHTPASRGAAAGGRPA
jgi:hypothetical protein